MCFDVHAIMSILAMYVIRLVWSMVYKSCYMLVVLIYVIFSVYQTHCWIFHTFCCKLNLLSIFSTKPTQTLIDMVISIDVNWSIMINNEQIFWQSISNCTICDVNWMIISHNAPYLIIHNMLRIHCITHCKRPNINCTINATGINNSSIKTTSILALIDMNWVVYLSNFCPLCADAIDSGWHNVHDRLSYP